jgi:hypothetical protein
MRYKIILSIFILLSICTFFEGCASSKQEEKNHFRFEVIDSALNKHNGNLCFELRNIDYKMFDKYIVLHCDYFVNKNNKIIDTVYFFILSEKDEDSTIDLKLYEKLNNSEKYCINLFTIDTLKRTDARIRGDAGFYYDDNDGCSILFWRDGKIVSKVYFSNGIKNIYIKK